MSKSNRAESHSVPSLILKKSPFAVCQLQLARITMLGVLTAHKAVIVVVVAGHNNGRCSTDETRRNTRFLNIVTDGLDESADDNVDSSF